MMLLLDLRRAVREASDLDNGNLVEYFSRPQTSDQ